MWFHPHVRGTSLLICVVPVTMLPHQTTDYRMEFPMPFHSVQASGPHRPTEPEVYVKIRPRGLSCEVPPHHLPALLRQFALDLHAKKITLRYYTHEDL